MKVIHRTLTGDVADIYLRNVPAFKGLDRERVYEMVMSSPALAAECYSLFEKRPDLFSHLLVDRAGQPIVGTEKRLRCGRSIDAVMAMVVRAVAKRHFLTRFGVKLAPPPAAPVESPKREKRLPKFIRFRADKTENKPMPKVLRKATRGDSLYRAMRHHLIHPWQLKLIPHYTPLPVSTVRQLGGKILDYKSIRDLKGLLKDGIAPEGEAKQEAAPAAPALIRVKLPENKTANSVAQAKAEAMWAVAEGLQLSEVFAVNEAEMRRIVNSAAIASGSVITALTSKGLSVRALVVMLCAFERQLGQNRLQFLFGQQAPKAFIDKLASMIGSSGMSGIEDPESIRNRAEVMIRQLQRDQALPH